MNRLHWLNILIRDKYRTERVENHFQRYTSSLAEMADRENCRFRLPAALEREYIDYYRGFGFERVAADQIKLLYSITGKFDKRIVPDSLFNLYIDPVYPEIRDFWQNKSYQNILVPEAKYPNTIVRNISGYYVDGDNRIISKEKALDLIKPYERVVIKPTVRTGGGADVRFLGGAEMNEDILGSYGKDFLVQEKLKQSVFMSQFNETAVCTDKICSFLCKGEVHILSSFLRIAGEGAENDNLTSNEKGSYVGIRKDGRLDEFGYNLHMGKVYQTGSGIKYSDIKLEYHKKCIEIIKKAHLRLLDFPFVSWDFAQGNDGEPVLIEYNLKWHSLFHYELFDGPVFGDMTDEILQDAAERARRNYSRLLFKRTVK